MTRFTAFFLPALAAPALALASDAQPQGYAYPWQLGFLTPASDQKAQLHDLHNVLLVIIAGVVALVLALMLWILVRYNHRANPVPATFSHNPKLEVIWTLIPAMILAVIAYLSLETHYFLEKDIEADMTIKVTGRQWYWSYEYPDHGGIAFDSYMKKPPADPYNPKPDELQPGEPRLLEVDNRLVVPVDANIKVLVTASDVIHSWALPSFGVKRDAVPGRLNETWFRPTHAGVFYGQCSELCGTGHAFMPIAVEVVSREAFDAWVKQKQAQAGIGAAEPPVRADASAASL
jgi:cytochrome c oxidase subunit 2